MYVYIYGICIQIIYVHAWVCVYGICTYTYMLYVDMYSVPEVSQDAHQRPAGEVAPVVGHTAARYRSIKVR